MLLLQEKLKLFPKKKFRIFIFLLKKSSDFNFFKHFDFFGSLNFENLYTIIVTNPHPVLMRSTPLQLINLKYKKDYEINIKIKY